MSSANRLTRGLLPLFLKLLLGIVIVALWALRAHGGDPGRRAPWEPVLADPAPLRFPALDPNGTIGVYFDPQGTQCQGTIPAGTTGKIYVVAHLAGATAGGIAGAEFRFTGLPEAWEAHAVPNPDILGQGNPFGSGVVLGFACKPPVEGTVLLYEVLVLAHGDVSDVEFQIESRDPPLSDPCPLLLECDDPVFTAYCVEGLSCFVNYTSPTTCERPIPLGVEESTWSLVKELYR